MKKQLLLFVSVIASLTASAQMAIPNGNFENWTSGTYDFPQYYFDNSNPNTFFQCHTAFNATKTTDAYHGGFALQLTTNYMAMDTCFGYIANANVSNGGPASWVGGMPISQKPLGIKGFYKYNVASADSAIIIVVARQGGVNIGTYFYTLGGIHGTYTPFNFTFSPALPVIPDSIIFATASSNAMANNGLPGSTLKMDSVAFTGITVQPSQLNGDFEFWQTKTLDSPDLWMDGNNRGAGILKTTDRVAGNFAVEIQTTLGTNNSGLHRAQPGVLSNGYWDNSCSCQKGGYPFSNQIDTLVFSYKYMPADPTDSASVYITFKNSGVSIWNEGKYLHSSPAYQLVQIPFNTMSTPDTAIIQIQSSAWVDSTVNFVGADLKIDEMHFKSMPLTTGINALHFKNEVNFYPNPFKTTGTIYISSEINTQGMEVTIYDLTGRIVRKIESNEHKVTIDRTNMENGIYFYELKTNSNVTKTGKIIIE